MSDSVVEMPLPPPDGPMATVKSASRIPDGPSRDAALLGALRDCRRELEDAESEYEATLLRLAHARDTFDCAAKMLAGGSPLPWASSLDQETSVTRCSTSSRENGIKRGGGSARSLSGIDQYGKRSKTISPLSFLENGNLERQTAEDLGAPVPPIVPTNLICRPTIHTSAGDALVGNANITIMSEQIVSTHRENFYQKLLGISASEVDNYTPSIGQTNPNLRSKSQLAEAIHIVRHWDTGAHGLDPAAFRSKHKTWYTKMKPVTQNMGRRTGIHIRTLEPQQEGEEEETVLCRYNRAGTKSTLYLDISLLYDALFEIHCLEHNHLRGKEAVKVRVDDLYANVPEQQVKVFVDTCPICVGRKVGQDAH